MNDRNDHATRQCPYCAEDTKPAARICPHCRGRLEHGGPSTLHRGHPGRQVAGVAIALAEHFAISVTFVRLVFVIAAFINLAGVVAYGLLWFFVPAAPGGRSLLETTVAALRIDDIDGRSLFDRLGERLRARFASFRNPPQPPANSGPGAERQPSGGAV